MNVLVALLTLLLLAAVVSLISYPLRIARRESPLKSADRAELEAAREAKYREIRDAELDYATGKLSDADYAAIDGALRAEAIEVLRQLDVLSDGESDTPTRTVEEQQLWSRSDERSRRDAAAQHADEDDRTDQAASA